MITNTRTAGQKLAERLDMTIIGMEADKLIVACPFCDSSDAGRIFLEGNYWCFACRKTLNAFDFCKVRLGDHEAAKRLMVDVGLFADRPHKQNGNDKPASDDGEAAFLEVCHHKRVPPDAWRKFGAKPWKGGVAIPMFGPDRERCSFIHITPKNSKGRYAKGKPTGIFFCGKFPEPGEKWTIVEGPKDAGALHALGFNVAGLPGNAMNDKFAPLFDGCNIVIVPDADKPGWEGARKTTKVLEGHAASVRIARLPTSVEESNGWDVRDILEAQGKNGPDNIRKVINEAEPAETAFAWLKGEGKEEPPRFIKLLTCPELLDLDLRPRFLVKDVLVTGQPAVVGGRSKTLKTNITTDLVVSLGSGTPFLGKFPTERVNVAFFSGESGPPTIRETALRQARSKGVDLSTCSIFWQFDLPKLSKPAHLAALRDLIAEHKLEVVVVDPLYLALLDADTAGQAANLFAMGAALQPISRLAQETDTTLIVLHHFRKSGQPDQEEPASLEELSMSGAAEWARQWLLLQRKSPYQADGHHELWMRCGGSAGHGSLWSLDIQEGTLDPDDFSGRYWDVVVQPAAEARAEAKQKRERRKAADLERRDGEYRDRLLAVLRKATEGDTERVLSRAARLNPDNFHRAISTLLQEGRATTCEIIKTGREYDGYKPTGK